MEQSKIIDTLDTYQPFFLLQPLTLMSCWAPPLLHPILLNTLNPSTQTCWNFGDWERKTRSTTWPNQIAFPTTFLPHWLVTLGAWAPRRLEVPPEASLLVVCSGEVCKGVVVAFKTNLEWFEAHPLGVTRRRLRWAFGGVPQALAPAPLQTESSSSPRKSELRDKILVLVSLVVNPFPHFT